MSDGDRGAGSPALGADLKFLVAVVLACVVGLLFGYLEGYQAERYQNSTREYAEAAKQNAIVTCADREPAAVADCVYDEMNSARETSQAEQDLQAQQWMARWAGILIIITAMTTLISWVALRYLRDTFQQTAKGAQAAAAATKAMIRQNELTEQAQRPWLSVTIRSLTNFRWDDDGKLRCDYVLLVSNSGNQPAIIVSEYVGLFPAKDKKFDRDVFIKSAYQLLTLKAGAVPPGATEAFAANSCLIETAGVPESGRNPNGSIPGFIVGVAYQGPKTALIHTTVLQLTVTGDVLNRSADPAVVQNVHVMKTLMD